MSKRMYSSTYMKYGFIAVEHGEESLPQCIICNTLANSAMKPCLLKGHLDSKIILTKRTELLSATW